jgi:WXG100 family type VII secretion target
MADFSAQLDTTSEIASDLGQCYTRLTQVGEELENKVRSSTAQFEGSTKDAFITVQQQYDQAHENMSNQLKAAQTALHQIHEALVQGEQSGTRMWS